MYCLTRWLELLLTLGGPASLLGRGAAGCPPLWHLRALELAHHGAEHLAQHLSHLIEGWC